MQGAVQPGTTGSRTSRRDVRLASGITGKSTQAAPIHVRGAGPTIQPCPATLLASTVKAPADSRGGSALAPPQATGQPEADAVPRRAAVPKRPVRLEAGRPADLPALPSAVRGPDRAAQLPTAVSTAAGWSTRQHGHPKPPASLRLATISHATGASRSLRRRCA